MERAGFVDEAAEGESGELGGCGQGMDHALAGDFGVHRCGIEGLKLADTPGCDGGLNDEVLGVGRTGLVGGAEGVERCTGWNREQRRGGLGIESVAEAVAGGVALAGGGDGSAGSGTVEAGGFALAGGSDHRFIMNQGWGRRLAEWGGWVLFCGS